MTFIDCKYCGKRAIEADNGACEECWKLGKTLDNDNYEQSDSVDLEAFVSVTLYKDGIVLDDHQEECSMFLSKKGTERLKSFLNKVYENNKK